MSPHVGMAGLGRMGLAMAQCLLDAGFPVSGFDVAGDRVDALVETGGRAERSNRAVAEIADVVVTCLPSAEALLSALTGDEGLLECRGSRPVIVEMSTLAVDDKLRGKAEADDRGFVLLDCPVSGGPPAAREGQLVIFASGDEQGVADCGPVLDTLARRYDHVGAFGSGMRMKLLANLLVAVHNVSTAEVMTLGMKAGIDAQQLFRVLSSTSGDSRMFQRRGPKMATNDFVSGEGISLELFDKDLRLVSELARSVDCPLPLFSTSRELYVAALAEGLGDMDSSAVFLALQRMAGLSGRPPSDA